MDYISLYRKWRPQRFDEVIGQEDVIKTLKNAIRSGRLAHAYLFCGPRGTGKTSTARILAKTINCKNIEKNIKDPEPCNECENCISITDGSSVDVIEFDAASHRGVEDADDLTKRVNYLPNLLKKKIYIIDEVHMLSNHAFNALLKTLEEPPEHVIFILATTAPEEIISTIISRCQKFDFKPINQDVIKERLKIAAAKENIDVGDAALSLIAKYSQGSQRDAYVLLEKLSSLDNSRIKVEDVASLIGAVDNEILFELTNIFIEKNVSELIFFMHRFEKSYYNIKVFVEEYLNHLQNLFVLKNYTNASEILNIGEDYKEKYLDQSKSIANSFIEYLIEVFSDFYNNNKELKPGSLLVFKAALIRAISIQNIKTESSAPAKKENYENRIKILEDRIKALESIDIYSIRLPGNKALIEKEKQAEAVDEKAQKIKEVESKAFIDEKIIKKDEIEKKEETLSGPINEKVTVEAKNSNFKTGDFVEIFKEKWEEVINHIKDEENSKPLASMLREIKSFSIKDENINLYLKNNYKWHKENLSKTENLNIVTKTIKMVLGYQLNVNYMLEKDGSGFIELKNYQQYHTEGRSSEEDIKKNILKENDSIEEKNKNFKVKEKNKKFQSASNAEDESYGYLMEKFNIKE